MAIRFEVKDLFWEDLINMVRTKMIPYQWDALNDRVNGAAKSHCVSNFRVAAGLEEGEFEGYPFQDTDAYKWIEAVSYCLEYCPDSALEAQADGLIDLICSAQLEDGYLDTYYIIRGIEDRFTNLMDNHELYCAGHLLEAGIAWCEATGKDKLLRAAMRYVDCIKSHINNEGGLPGYPGHEILEMALLRCYRFNGDKDALAYAEYLLSERGKAPSFFLEEAKRAGRVPNWMDGPLGLDYYQAAKPVKEQREAVGHAVRAAYLYSAMADYWALTGDEEMGAAAKSIWKNMTGKKMFITGGFGSSPYGEAFTFDYDLPSDSCYCETCASVGAVFFADRMFRAEKRGEYHDVIERILYNALLAGVDESGTRYSYANPLEMVPEAVQKDAGKRHLSPVRLPWFDCACCPPNLARLVTSVGRYVCEEADGAIYINQYISGRARVGSGSISIESELPISGRITLTLSGIEAPVYLRVPSWSRYTRIIAERKAVDTDSPDGYALLPKGVKKVSVFLDMAPRFMRSSDKVRDTFGKLALMCGPTVYCAEEADNGKELHKLCLSVDSAVEQDGDKLVVNGWRRSTHESGLYFAAGGFDLERAKLVMTPYRLWGNRGEGEMRVWIDER